jgi:hypothetical protein
MYQENILDDYPNLTSAAPNHNFNNSNVAQRGNQN